MKLEQVAQKQINSIMDWGDFSNAEKALAKVKNCWLNDEEFEECRESFLRKKCREFLEQACQKAIENYKNKNKYFVDLEGNGFYKYSITTGCICAKALICDKDPWIKVNLYISVFDSMQDGESFEE